MGIEPERVRLEWISASEGDRLRDVMNEMVEQLKQLGPLHLDADSARRTAVRRRPPNRECRRAMKEPDHEQTEGRLLLVCLLRRLRGGGGRPGRGDPRGRRAGRHRLLALRHGLQARGRRGDGRRRDGRLLRQRGGPHVRAAGDGRAVPPQVAAADRLRQLLAHGRHSRAGQPVLARVDPRNGLRRRRLQHRQPRQGRGRRRIRSGPKGPSNCRSWTRRSRRSTRS